MCDVTIGERKMIVENHAYFVSNSTAAFPALISPMTEGCSRTIS